MKLFPGKYSPDPDKYISASSQNKILFITILILILFTAGYILSFYL